MTQSATERESLVRGNTGLQLGLVTTGTLTFATGQYAISPLLPSIIDSLGVSEFAVGIALSLMFGVTALVRYPSGQLSDDLSRKTVLVAGLVVSTVGFVLLTFVEGYGMFVFGVTCVGIGVGLYSTSAIAWLSDLFVEKRGQAMGVNNGSVYLAGILGALFANAALFVGAWRTAFLPIVLALVVLLPAVHLWNGEPYSIERPKFDNRGTAVRLFRLKRVRWMIIVAALFGMAWQGVITFLPTFLQAEKALTPAFANNLFALLFVIGIGSNLLAGRFADRFPVPLLISGVALLTAAGLAVVILTNIPAVLIAGIIVLGAGLAAIWPALQAYMMTTFPEESKGADFGAFSAVYGLIASLGPSIVGFMVGRWNFTVAFGTLVVCLLVSSLLALQLVRQS